MPDSPNVDISTLASIGQGTKVWDFSKVCDDVRIGRSSIIGRSVYIGPGVEIGNNCKIQNSVLIYEPAKIGHGVFIGPGVIFTNDLNPRAVTSAFELKTQNDWVKQGVTVEDGASIGAGSICVAPVSIGKWAMVGAGSVVTKDVPDFALVVGNPAIGVNTLVPLGKFKPRLDVNAANINKLALEPLLVKMPNFLPNRFGKRDSNLIPS